MAARPGPLNDGGDRGTRFDGSAERLYRRALALAVFTIVYNLLEGAVSTWFGAADDSLTLFGFGVDSFIEAASGLGIAHMVVRTRSNPAGGRDTFERRALTITGYAFHTLAAALSVTIVVNVLTGHRPESTLPGVAISVISIGVMLWLIRAKTRVGEALVSAAIIADARCTKVCVYMSVVLLASSALYELTGFAHLDSIGAAGLAWFSFTEGKECLGKAAGGAGCSCESRPVTPEG